ncbi:MAG: AAA family ATPase [Phycisphaerales bacterium]
MTHAHAASASIDPADLTGRKIFSDVARTINAGVARALLLAGQVDDLFLLDEAREAGAAGLPEDGGDAAGETADGTSDGTTDGSHVPGQWVPLLSMLTRRASVPGFMVLVYELNGPIRIVEADVQGRPAAERLREAWTAWRLGASSADSLVLESLDDPRRQRERQAEGSEFDRRVRDAVGRPTMALEFLRQLCRCSRATSHRGEAFLAENLFIVIEGTDLILPSGGGDISRLTPVDRHRLSVVRDWFGDPDFMAAGDSVVLLTESRGAVHPSINAMPAVAAIDVPAPAAVDRRAYLRWFAAEVGPVEAWADEDAVTAMTAGLSIHALRRMLLTARHAGTALSPSDVIDQVGQVIAASLGEDVVEFKRPTHRLDDVVGNTRLKGFIETELLPRFRAGRDAALPGAAVAGPIGSGKTFIFEAVAASLDMPVLTLKNIRSQWFGQTDVIFERLRRVLTSLDKVVVFIDEADTQFGGVGSGTHDTERRLTGRIQQMMSDPALRGRVIWLLMTARIHLLSPDIRRPGRVGDLILPVLDPEGADRDAFLDWAVKKALGRDLTDAERRTLKDQVSGWSAAAFAALRSALVARVALAADQAARGGGDGAEAGAGDVEASEGGAETPGESATSVTIDDIHAVLDDLIPPAIERTRRYQALQAMLNCTRRSLLPPGTGPDDREGWRDEIAMLERAGEA